MALKIFFSITGVLLFLYGIVVMWCYEKRHPRHGMVLTSRNGQASRISLEESLLYFPWEDKNIIHIDISFRQINFFIGKRTLVFYGASSPYWAGAKKLAQDLARQLVDGARIHDVVIDSEWIAWQLMTFRSFDFRERVLSLEKSVLKSSSYTEAFTRVECMVNSPDIKERFFPGIAGIKQLVLFYLFAERLISQQNQRSEK